MPVKDLKEVLFGRKMVVKKVGKMLINKIVNTSICKPACTSK